MNIKGAIFDMDGTVANTINSIKYFANNALKKAGLDEIDTETYKVIVGNGAKVLVERMLKTVGADEKYFDDADHLNEDGARVYTSWLVETYGKEAS